MLQKPPYPIESVDRALRLLEMLRDEGAIKLTQAASELDIAPSTAHRLFAMLVYRGFAVQDGARSYVPGPALGVGPARLNWSRKLREISQPHLELLCSRLNETTNLMIRVGTKVRFLVSVESEHVLRVGGRQGMVLPASGASGGKALLSALPPPILAQMYASPTARRLEDGLDARQFSALMADLAVVQRTGFATNVQNTELGVGAIGMTISGVGLRPVAAISVSAPIVRFSKLVIPETLDIMRITQRDLGTGLLANGIGLDYA